jgi:glyoxylase-like metal-dependent hydrolase (beta-lactamase superfamily II)
MRLLPLRSITVPFTAALSLLALTGCPDDTGSDGTESNTESSTTTGTTVEPSTTIPDPDTTAGETESTTGSSTSSSSGSTSEDSTTGEGVGLLPRVLEAIGGERDLINLSQVEIVGAGDRFIPDEGYIPGDPAVNCSSFDTTTAIDFDNVGIHIDITRTPFFFPVPMPLVVTEIVDGDVGYVEGIESVFGIPTGDMLSDRMASTVKQQRLFNPHFLLKELIADPSLASEIAPADFDGTMYDRLEVDDPIFPLTLWVDPTSSLIARITTMENAHLHRDVELDVRYADWQDTDDGVLFPNQVQLYLGGELVHDEARSSVASNPGLPATTFDLPAGSMAMFDAAEADRGARSHQHNQLFTSIGVPIDGLVLTVAPAEVAPGVWHLTGGSHHTVIVEQDNGLVMFDAPLYAQRCEAILDWIDADLGGAPITHLIVSHHHEDHVACARVIAATGATFVVHEDSEAYFDEVLAAPSTIEPDRLELMPVVPMVEVIAAGSTYFLDDTNNPIMVYPLVSTHAVDMVLPFVESAGIAYTVDIFSPGFPANPVGAQEVLDAFDAAGITADVDGVVGGHGFGPPATVADVMQAAGV